MDLDDRCVVTLAGPEFDSGDDDDLEHAIEEAVWEVVRREFGRVSNAQKSAAGNDSALFAALGLSRDAEDSELLELSDDVLDETLNTDIMEKGAAFEWVMRLRLHFPEQPRLGQGSEIMHRAFRTYRVRAVS